LCHLYEFLVAKDTMVWFDFALRDFWLLIWWATVDSTSVFREAGLQDNVQVGAHTVIVKWLEIENVNELSTTFSAILFKHCFHEFLSICQSHIALTIN
jgi:hypothetical protein